MLLCWVLTCGMLCLRCCDYLQGVPSGGAGAGSRVCGAEPHPRQGGHPYQGHVMVTSFIGWVGAWPHGRAHVQTHRPTSLGKAGTGLIKAL